MSHLLPLTPALFVAGANALADLGDRVPPELMALFRRRCGRDFGPWHTAFVYHVGWAAHYIAETRHSFWPLPATADCGELARFAEARRILVREPRDGDVMLLWSRRECRFVRSGIVLATVARGPDRDPWFDCLTVEADTNESGALRGRGVHRLRRPIRPSAGHRFIRWVDLDGRNAAAEEAFRRRPMSLCLSRVMQRPGARVLVHSS